MAWNLRASDRIGAIMDSLGANFGQCYSPLISLMQLVDDAFGPIHMPSVSNPAMQPLRQKRPRVFLNAQSGRATADIYLAMATTCAALPKLTKVLVWLGINDADALRTGGLADIATFKTQVNAIIADLISRYGIAASDILWVSAWAHGTASPGDDASQIAAINAALVERAAALGFTVVLVSSIPNQDVNGQTINDGTHPLQPASDPMGALAFAACRFPAG